MSPSLHGPPPACDPLSPGPSKSDPSPARRAALLFTLSSGGAVLVGCLVAAAHAVPAAAWARNAGAWLVGALLATALARLAPARAAWVCLPMAVLALSATLLEGGLSGVHRWILLGPLRLNAAALFLPMTVVAWTDVVARRHPLWVSVPGIALLLALQPDASQAVALAGAVLAVLLTRGPADARVRMTAILCAGTAALALLRPDPLRPVPEVEGILGLALATSPPLALLAVLTLAGAVLSPLAATRGPHASSGAAAHGLTVYLALSALAPGLGAFPVPLVGMGASPILGAWCGLGLLVGLGQRGRV